MLSHDGHDCVPSESTDVFDVCYYIGERLKIDRETEVAHGDDDVTRSILLRRIWAFVRKSGRGMTAEVLMATPCTRSLGCESGGHKHGGDEGRKLCWKLAEMWK